MGNLTPRQSEAVLFVKRYVRQHGFAPSIREVASGLGVAVTAAVGHLRAAERKGAIRRASRTARGLVVRDATDRKPTRRGDRAHAATK